MINRIFLDIDDVLNGLSLHIMRHFGCDVGPFDYGLYPINIGYDIITAVEMCGGSCPSDPATFWDEVTAADLWKTTPKSPQCDWLIEKAAGIVGQEEVLLATSPTKDPQSHSDKLYWIQNNLPEWIQRQYFITPRKWLLGKPGAVLFDDNIENCDKFGEEGGRAILVPRPWNPLNPLNTDEELTRCLLKLSEEKIHV